ncbi:MAG: 16S rRNA (guanine(527)-N(7))-methyltransferase RsmG [Clostridia bacterium]|nr:16S rRNA (guanine(527)-N(7))-methyltransferase RsmG [Clostridia bacterium]
MNTEKTIQNLFALHNTPINDVQAAYFCRFFELLTTFNQQFNLTAITELEQVVVKHFIDSILNHKYYKSGAYICDMGSGAGFPGIPLKIMRPDLKIILVDSLQKRVNFLNTVIKELNLQDITAVHSRAQELKQQIPFESFDYITARAVAPLNVLIELCVPYIKINGEMVALKATNYENEIIEAEHALDCLNSKISNIEEYKLNNGEYTRNIIYITKQAKTNPIYPRPKNKIELKPL